MIFTSSYDKEKFYVVYSVHGCRSPIELAIIRLLTEEAATF